MKLEGQVTWVSGAASGMGEATAMLFAQEGACVAVVDINAERGQSIADEIRRLTPLPPSPPVGGEGGQGGEAPVEINGKGGRVRFVHCDVANEAQVRESIETTVQCFGALHIIVNCAGVVHVKPLHEYTEAEWDHLMGVNVKSIFFSIKHGWKYLSQHNRSYMVNIGSVGAFIGQSLTPAYTASKGAVLQLSRSIALDYAAGGLRCNCICPGITDTPMLRDHLSMTPDPEATLAGRLRRVPMGIALTPHDIAKAVLYFSCDDSAGITGTSLIVDGGYIAAAEWNTGGKTAFMEAPQ